MTAGTVISRIWAGIKRTADSILKHSSRDGVINGSYYTRRRLYLNCQTAPTKQNQ